MGQKQQEVQGSVTPMLVRREEGGGRKTDGSNETVEKIGEDVIVRRHASGRVPEDVRSDVVGDMLLVLLDTCARRAISDQRQHHPQGHERILDKVRLTLEQLPRDHFR
jgi:hypothetical protein